jgi:membrane-bound ClpP family serine protease
VIFLVGVALALFVVPDGWEIPTVLGFALLEVVETTVTWRLSRRRAPKVGPETLIGAVGRATSDCRPNGTARVSGDTWQARCEAGVAAGEQVRVVDRDRLILVVEPFDAGSARDGAETPR